MAIWTYKGLKFGIKSVKFPKEHDFYNGFYSSISFNIDKCINYHNHNNLDKKGVDKCKQCQNVCPTKSINLSFLSDLVKNKSIDEADLKTGIIDKIIDKNRCIYCGLCIQSCNNISGAINFGQDFESKRLNQSDKDKDRLNKGNKRAAKANFFKKSLFVKHIDAGSCGACELEIIALNNPYYNMHRLGIFITPSPRFADVIILTGVFTKKMGSIFYNVLDNTPKPRYIVLMGACSLSGGIFRENNNKLENCGVNKYKYLDHNSEQINNNYNLGFLDNTQNRMLIESENIIIVPGCPPNPFEMLNALLILKNAGLPADKSL